MWFQWRPKSGTGARSYPNMSLTPDFLILSMDKGQCTGDCSICVLLYFVSVLTCFSTPSYLLLFFNKRKTGKYKAYTLFLFLKHFKSHICCTQHMSAHICFPIFLKINQNFGDLSSLSLPIVICKQNFILLFFDKSHSDQSLLLLSQNCLTTLP